MKALLALAVTVAFSANAETINFDDANAGGRGTEDANWVYLQAILNF